MGGMKAWVKRNETPLIWVWGVAMILAMLAFPALGLWSYLVFVSLAAPIVGASAYRALKGNSLSREEFLGMTIVLGVIILGAYSFIRR